MWRDTYKVSKIEGYPLTWDKRDLEYALESWITHDYQEWFTVGAWRCRLHRAGHMPGAAMIEIETPLFYPRFPSKLLLRQEAWPYGNHAHRHASHQRFDLHIVPKSAHPNQIGRAHV